MMPYSKSSHFIQFLSFLSPFLNIYLGRSRALVMRVKRLVMLDYPVNNTRQLMSTSHDNLLFT